MNVRALMIILTQNNCSVPQLAKLLCISKSSIYRKLSGVCDFSRAEIAVMKKMFSLSSEKLVEIFFCGERV